MKCRPARGPKGEARTSSSKTRHHSLINLPRHSNIVEVVFTDILKPTCLVQIKNFASFDVGSFTRFNSKCPRKIVETYAASSISEPPLAHGVEHATNVVVCQVDERPRRDAIHQTSLKDKRQIETDDV